MDGSFLDDPNIQKIAEAYALDAVDLAANNFSVKLDWSDASIKSVEKILDVMYSSKEKEKSTPETIYVFAKALGSYLGAHESPHF
jgi:hypothetical protein